MQTVSLPTHLGWGGTMYNPGTFAAKPFCHTWQASYLLVLSNSAQSISLVPNASHQSRISAHHPLPLESLDTQVQVQGKEHPPLVRTLLHLCRGLLNYWVTSLPSAQPPAPPLPKHSLCSLPHQAVTQVHGDTIVLNVLSGPAHSLPVIRPITAYREMWLAHVVTA